MEDIDFDGWNGQCNNLVPSKAVALDAEWAEALAHRVSVVPRQEKATRNRNPDVDMHRVLST